MHKTNHKIAIISASLGSGGAERFAGQLSFILHELDYEIHHIIINNQIDYAYKGELHNLGQLCEQDSFLFKKINKGILLNRYLNENSIDIIIDNRSRNLFLRDFIAKIIYGKRKLFYMIHSYNLRNYLPNSIILANLLYQNATKLICVSKSIEDQVKARYHFKNTTTIYNSINVNYDIKVDKDIPENYILFFGRLNEKVKNFSLLLSAFSISKIYEKGFQLLILGNGPDADFIQNTIDSYQLQNYVRILPFQQHPFDLVKNAKFTVLTSHYEGFPMSILESLSLGTPVISVNCNSGPAEIITNEYNGLLVENYNSNDLAHAMIRFVEDYNLYDICKNNASISLAKFSSENIAIHWKAILS